MPHVKVEQGSPQWHALHLGRITASRAAACLRIGGKKGPLSAWKEIMGLSDRMANEYMVYGQRNEEAARQDYYDFGRSQEPPLFEELRPGDFWTHPKYDWLGASPDFLAEPGGCGDLKCPRLRLPDAIPPEHEVQLRVQMACCDRDWADYYAWMGDRNYYYERLYRDARAEADIVARLREFWLRHVLGGVRPPLRRGSGCAKET